MNPPDGGKIIVINIIAPSYSGSTWLNLMLGSHSQVFSIGEFDGVRKFGQAFCRRHGEDCPIWSQFDPDNDENDYLQVSRITGKRLLVVNNVRRYLPDQKHPQIDARYLWLVRDGRAILASGLRKFKDQSVWKISRGWKRSIVKKRRMIQHQPSDKVMALHYERVQADAPASLRQICDFLGLEYEPDMIEFTKKDHCLIGGNLGPLTQLAEAQHKANADVPQELVQTDRPKPEWDTNFYKQQKATEFRDERWKTDLTDGQLRLFGWVAGCVNRSLGYPSSRDRRGLMD